MLEWIKENKDYASLYSAMVATGAFVFSIFTFLVSVIRVNITVRRSRQSGVARATCPD